MPSETLIGGMKLPKVMRITMIGKIKLYSIFFMIGIKMNK